RANIPVSGTSRPGGRAGGGRANGGAAGGGAPDRAVPSMVTPRADLRCNILGSRLPAHPSWDPKPPDGGTMRTHGDAIVVGAGHNGLVAATQLADAGWDVLVCEAATEPGGAVRSAEVTAPGFITDLGSGFYPLGVASPVLTGLDLAEHGLAWRHAPLV